MPEPRIDTEALLARAAKGDAEARDSLLQCHRPQLDRLVRLRMDPRLAGRLDPSDVVQEVLLDASRKLSDYLKDRPLPFYPWLRAIAWERLVKLHRHHMGAGKRDVRREQGLPLPDESAIPLADHLIDRHSGPRSHLVREEMRRRVRSALEQLAEADREVLVLRYLEQLSMREIAAVTDTTEAAARQRHARALRRLGALLERGPEASQ